MIVKTIHDEGSEYNEYESLDTVLIVHPDGEHVEQYNMSFGAGEPEDMILGRDLNDAYTIQTALIAAYEAGKRGEPLEVIEEEAEQE